jgi:hypothetical protein
MKHPRPVLLAALAVFILASPSRADLIQWGFSWTNTPSLTADSGMGGVSFSNQAAIPAAGNTSVVATNLTLVSTAPAAHPDTFNNAGTYTLTLRLTDAASTQSGTLSWTGKLGGSFSMNSAAVTNTFLSPITQELDLGTNAYTVTIGGYLPPGPPGTQNPGAIGATVEVSSLIPGGDPGTSGGPSPEPSSLLLCGLGAAGCALAGWRRRRARRQAILAAE